MDMIMRAELEIRIVLVFIISKMGGAGSSSNPFYASDGGKDSELARLLEEFSFVSVYEDELFGRCSIIEHKQTKQLIVTKDIRCETEPEAKKLQTDFQKRKSTLTNSNLLRLRYIIRKKTEGLFSDEHKIILFFDYVVASILSQFRNRAKMSKPFTNQQVNIAICGALRAYAALQQHSIPNSKVRLSNIYFGLENKMPIPKVIDANLFPTPTNTQAARKMEETDQIFLSPEELKNLDDPKYYNPKSGVYSLGVSIVQLCLLVPSKDLYNYNKRTINYAELQNRLNIIKNKYPLSVYCLLRDMLERNDDSRPSFTKLAESLPSNLKNLPSTMNISLMKSLDGTQNTKILGSSANGFSKVLNPLVASRSSKRMQGTLAAQYRPQIEVSEVYTNGNRYEGQTKDNLRHGRGKYIYADGSYYIGDWKKAKMDGQGQLYDSNSNLVYDGNWKDDHYEGAGRLMGFGTDWTKYQGEFTCGKMQGFGEMWFYDGKRYKGQFRNDLPWGKGRMFSKNGEIQNGLWERGNFISQF